MATSPMLFFFFLFAFMTVSASQQIVDPAALNITYQSARNFSSVTSFPLFSMRTTNASSSSSLVKALKPPSSKTSASFVYDDVTLMAEVMLGTPPQRRKMVLDTGSELSWLPCKPGNPSSFKPVMSSTYTSVSCRSPVCTTKTKDFPLPTTCDNKRLCHFTYTYADGTDIEGNLATDSLTLPSLKIPGFVFGCSSSDPVPSTPGLMGLNRGALSFISQVTATHKFSYCISDRIGSPGVLVLGESPFAKYLHYTPLLTMSLPLPYFNRAAYSVRLEGIKVGNKLLPIPKSVFLPDHTGAGQTMIDSGTQFTLLLGEAYKTLKQEFVQQNRGRMTPMAGDFMFQGLDLCYELPAGAALFPLVSPVTLLFNSAQVTLQSRQLLYPVPRGSAPASNGRAIYCFTFGNSDLVPVEANIIGNHHQQNLWIEYDLPNSRIGFARARCSNK